MRTYFVAFGVVTSLLLSPVSPVAARDYYVSATGKDSSRTGSKEAPFLTVRKAASAAEAGDRVLIRGGTYAEQIKLQHSGKPDAWIAFQAEPGTGEVVFKHPATKPTRSAVFEIADRHYIRLENLSFKDFPYGRPISLTNSSHIEVAGCVFENVGQSERSKSGQAVQVFRSGPGVVIRDNRFRKVYGDAIKFSAVLESSILHNDISEMQSKMVGDQRGDEGAEIPKCCGIKTSEWGRELEGNLKDAGYNEIAFNIVHDFQGSGTHADVASCFNIYHHNVFRNVKGKCVYLESRCSYNLVYQNLVMDSAVGYNSCSGNGWTFGNQYVNNVAFRNSSGFVFTGTSHNVVRNNIACGNKQYQVLVGPPAARIDHNVFENNLWYSADSPQLGSWDVWKPSKDTPSIAFSDWTRLSGERQGQWADPAFRSIVEGKEDFHLADDSPARGVGAYGVDLGLYPEGQQTAGQTLPRVFFQKHATESSEGAKTKLQMKVLLDKPCGQPVVVSYGTEGSAMPGTDFQIANDPLVFQPGEVEKTIELEICDDSEQEPLELVLVDLEGAEGAIIAMPRTHLHGIRDDDGPLSAPSNLTATRLPDGTVQLRWTDNSAVEQRFVIFRRSSSAEEWTSLRTFDQQAWQVATNDTSYVDRSAKPGASYEYMVRATSLMRAQPPEGMVLMRDTPSEGSNTATVVESQ